MIKICRFTVDSSFIWRRQWHTTPVLLPGESQGRGSLVGCSPWGCWESGSQTWLSDFTFTFHFHALEKGMEAHSSVLAWRIPETGEPGGLPSMGSHRVGHDWSDLAAHIIEKDCDARKDWRQEEKETAEDEMIGWRHWHNGQSEQTLGDSEGQGSLKCCIPWGCK